MGIGYWKGTMDWITWNKSTGNANDPPLAWVPIMVLRPILLSDIDRRIRFQLAFSYIFRNAFWFVLWLCSRTFRRSTFGYSSIFKGWTLAGDPWLIVVRRTITYWLGYPFSPARRCLGKPEKIADFSYYWFNSVFLLCRILAAYQAMMDHEKDLARILLFCSLFVVVGDLVLQYYFVERTLVAQL